MKYLLILFALASCSKQYEAPVFWDVKINRSADTLTAVVYNTKSQNLRYIWRVNDEFNAADTTNKFVLKPGRNSIQLSILDDKGNSISEYLNLTK